MTSAEDFGRAVAAALTDRGRTFLGRALQPVTDRFAFTGAGSIMSNGSDTAANSHIGYQMVRNVQAISIAYSNYSDFNGAATPNAITVRAGVRANGAWLPVFFNGRRDVVIEPDGIVVSDPVGLVLAAGATLEVRSRVVVASGEKWSNTLLSDNALGEGTETGTGTADKTTNGGTITASRAYCFAPFTILAAPSRGAESRTLVGVGDSIMSQAHDTINVAVSPTSTLGWGFVRRWAYPNKIPFINLGVVGDTVQAWVSTGGRKYAYRRAQIVDGSTVIINFGRNDLDAGRTLAQIQSDMTIAWEQIARTGASVWQTTITPKTVSVDSWATTVGQTVTSSEDARVALNDWLRTVPSPLAGVLDVADAVETARNSGIWKSSGNPNTWTDDGLHPTIAGHAAMAGVFPVGFIV